MKSKGSPKGSITKPLLKEVVDRDKANQKANFETPSIGSTPLESAELDQDAGSGYNPNHTFPQT